MAMIIISPGYSTDLENQEIINYYRKWKKEKGIKKEK